MHRLNSSLQHALKVLAGQVEGGGGGPINGSSGAIGFPDPPEENNGLESTASVAGSGPREARRLAVRGSWDRMRVLLLLLLLSKLGSDRSGDELKKQDMRASSCSLRLGGRGEVDRKMFPYKDGGDWRW